MPGTWPLIPARSDGSGLPDGSGLFMRCSRLICRSNLSLLRFQLHPAGYPVVGLSSLCVVLPCPPAWLRLQKPHWGCWCFCFWHRTAHPQPQAPATCARYKHTARHPADTCVYVATAKWHVIAAGGGAGDCKKAGWQVEMGGWVGSSVRRRKTPERKKEEREGQSPVSCGHPTASSGQQSAACKGWHEQVVILE